MVFVRNHPEGKMKKILFCFFAATILLWFSCSKKMEEGANVEVIDGIEYVHNSETPKYPERTVVFEEELSIRSEDEKGNILLYRPGWHLVDRKGFLYLDKYLLCVR